MTFRIEKDILGEIEVPSGAYWGVNTQRAIQNFKISGKVFPQIFIITLAQVKKASLLANMELGLVDNNKGNAILKAVDEILDENKFLDQFPIDIYQTGSGTQTNMNMNEVLANRANEILGYPMGKKHPVHPNDDVNRCQSSNDIIPSVMHVATLHLMNRELFPALNQLKKGIGKKIMEFSEIIKVGRTHLQDAVPIPLSLEFEVYKQQIEINENRLKNAYIELQYLPIGGSALGTGLNVHEGFTEKALTHLTNITKFKLHPNPVKAEGISSHNTIANVSANLKLLALSLLKMANDIRWMGSGPRAGLSELILPQNEPGSSIMPGKINPTQSEALIQVCLQVMGNDSVISFAEAYGSILDLNVCKPVMISNLLESISILTGAINSFIIHCLDGLQANKPQIDRHLEQLLMLVTNLTPIIGYDKCSIIAKKAHEEDKTIKEVINDMGIQIEGDIDEILDPKKMV